MKGDTATGATKPATMERAWWWTSRYSSMKGQTIKVSTSAGTYIERVQNASEPPVCPQVYPVLAGHVLSA